MKAPLSVRRTLENDGPLLRELRIASLIDSPAAFGARLDDVLSEPPRAYDDVAARHSRSQRSTSFLLFAGSTAIGTVGAFFEEAALDRAFICALWVKPEFRGGDAASQLLDTAVEWLHAGGAREVYAWVTDSNARAIGFYRKFGFRPTNVTQTLPSNPQESETLFHYPAVAESRGQ
jgi:ribosomal protein S18 acetylase RimI-like enzyme